jgi:hypothetical protein
MLAIQLTGKGGPDAGLAELGPHLAPYRAFLEAWRLGTGDLAGRLPDGLPDSIRGVLLTWAGLIGGLSADDVLATGRSGRYGAGPVRRMAGPQTQPRRPLTGPASLRKRRGERRSWRSSGSRAANHDNSKR